MLYVCLTIGFLLLPQFLVNIGILGLIKKVKELTEEAKKQTSVIITPNSE